ncbi:MAG TPA: hypothetical protein VLW75_03070, partial [Rhizomicrobium sp.]|nr:hypothetical protein [Rhizomicrobium sp.]
MKNYLALPALLLGSTLLAGAALADPSNSNNPPPHPQFGYGGHGHPSFSAPGNAAPSSAPSGGASTHASH